MKYSPPPAFLDLCQSDRSAETPFFNFLSTFTHRGQAHTDGMIINTNTITYRDRPQRTETRKKRAFPKGPPLCQAPSRQHPPPRTAAKGGALKRDKTFCGIFAPAGGTAREHVLAPQPHLIYIYPSTAHIRAGGHHLHANRGYRLHRAHIFRSVVVQGKIFFVLLRCK